MKLKNKIITLLCLLPLFYGCSDFLNLKNESEVNPDIWNDVTSAQLYINQIYKMCLPEFGGDKIVDDRPAACSDETGGDTNNMLAGTLDFGKVSKFSAASYSAIRYINIGLEELDKSTMLTEDYNKIAGQLYFFRAWQHWKMVLMHGGVPYMTHVVDYASDYELTNSKRDKTSDCITYLKEDLTKAMNMLPAKWTKEDDWGKVTSAAAAALMGRILVYYASPQFTPDQSGEVAKARWQDAYVANQKAVEICTSAGYGLYDCTTKVTDEWPVATDINLLFTSATQTTNKEALFVRVYDGADNSHGYEASVRPGMQTGGTSRPSNLPSLRLVMAFPNADGTPYTKAGNDLTFWKDRDPRFYSTIVYNGCYYPYAGNSVYRQWTYTGGDPSATSAASNTGYYCRKMVDPNTKLYSKTSTNWIEIRYAEVLLNLAEAALETGNDDVMYNCLGQIRQRAGIPEGDSYYGLKAQSDMNKLELIMNERFIELAFEGKRFFDLRRRNMFTSDLGSVTKKMNGEKKMTWSVTYRYKKNGSAALKAFAEIRDGLTMDEVTSNMLATQTSATPQAAPIAYICVPTAEELAGTTTGNYNFFDVPTGILSRSPAIQQTMGWSYDAERGCFNPFE